MKTKRGFSLVELLMVTGIFTMIMGGLVMTLLAGNRSWDASENAVAIQRDARNAMWSMTKDLRKASGATISQSSSGATLNFTHPTDGAVTYSWALGGGNAKKVFRQTATKTRTVASNISALSFTDQSTSMLITMTVSRKGALGPTANLTMAQEVAYR